MSDKHDNVRRKPQRLAGFDYSQGYAYFVTLSLANRSNLFGAITHTGQVLLTPAGEMIKQVWLTMPEYNPGLILDEFVVMPDHFHAILGFVDPQFWSEQYRSAADRPNGLTINGSRKRLSLPDIVRRFKTLTTRYYGDGVRQFDWLPYDGHLWQRSFWDRILRNDRDLETHRKYIYNNPTSKLMKAPAATNREVTG